MEARVTSPTQVCYGHLRTISHVRRYLTAKTAEQLVHCFVTSHLDSGNSLLYGLPDSLLSKLQAVSSRSCCQNHYRNQTPCAHQFSSSRPTVAACEVANLLQNNAHDLQGAPRPSTTISIRTHLALQASPCSVLLISAPAASSHDRAGYLWTTLLLACSPNSLEQLASFTQSH